MAAARTYTAAQHKAEVDRAVAEAVAATKAKEREDRINTWIDREEERQVAHDKLHRDLTEGLTEIREELHAINKTAVIVTDPKLFEAAPALLASLQREQQRGGERRQYWNGWKGRVAVLVSVGGFVMITLTSFGVLPPRPTVPVPVTSPSPRHSP